MGGESDGELNWCFRVDFNRDENIPNGFDLAEFDFLKIRIFNIL